jgi:hypothetical protein
VPCSAAVEGRGGAIRKLMSGTRHQVEGGLMPLIWAGRRDGRQTSGHPKNQPVAIRKVVAIQARTLSVGQTRKVLRCPQFVKTSRQLLFCIKACGARV